MTVSRVLRGDATVRTPTRRRVLAAMRELDYVPSPAARALRSKDRLRATGSLCFALIFGADTQAGDGFFCDVARGAEAQAADVGLSPIQVHWQESLEASWPRLQTVCTIPGLCGAILAGEFTHDEVEAVHARIGRVVIVDGPAPADLPVAAVETDNRGGCAMALGHLRERGAERILVLTGPPKHYFAQAMAAAAEACRPQCRELVIEATDYSPEAGRAVVVRRWRAGERFDGIFGNDELAIGALRGLADLGAAVPGEVRVIGFDDVPHAAFVQPRLSSISIDKRRLGGEAVATLVELVRRGGEARGLKKVITASLVRRDST